ncbi:uncharacterized protein LOC127879502 [Dreissena polymorpha]|uniref:Mab-21-like HhH/H2TH-like domain-containing protein n=1 Tax=Dreissena polymorpha TaxID=45954 RepID=A0A9D4KKD7_DREPO|nr:uncharacterized protein LOC127879502 [Dreissena polymorpha]KAH3841165.1 hypothetical protein DPMN_114623 [Dreissena polymorpha]
MDDVDKGMRKSFALSAVMADIGVTQEIAALRRGVNWLLEKLISMFLKTSGVDCEIYIFGSQTEGSTTVGMLSDFDFLYCSDSKCVCLTVAEYQANKMNFLVIKDDTSLPQCCSLQLIIESKDGPPMPVPATNVSQDKTHHFKDIAFIVNQKHQVLLSNTFERLNIVNKVSPWMVNISYSGPAVGLFGQDFVYAMHCPKLPDDYASFFHRPRPGHWPKLETIARAKENGVFLVPHGPPKSGNNCAFDELSSTGTMLVKLHSGSIAGLTQWRFTTNNIERCLMFDLNEVQMQAYVVTKIIRKELFVPSVGDRLSTFHFKTALFFTVEQVPPQLWIGYKDIEQCVIYCLTTLKRFLQKRYCPHYTIAGVNLFEDKIRTHEYNSLIKRIDGLIETQLECMNAITMDRIGLRLQLYFSEVPIQHDRRILELRYRSRYIIASALFQTFFTTLCIYSTFFEYKKDPKLNKTDLENFTTYLNACSQNLQTAAVAYTLFAREFYMIADMVTSVSASLSASSCLEEKQTVTKEIYQMYQSSLCSGLMCNYIRFATFLFCDGQFQRAAYFLNKAERMITLNILQISIGDRQPHQVSECVPAYDIPLSETLKNTAVCLVFCNRERNCIPWLLQFELHKKSIARSNSNRGYKFEFSDLAVVDSIPFLFYLQYLTFRELLNRDNQLMALTKLKDYLSFESKDLPRTSDCGASTPLHGFIETTLAMVGHCYELEERIDRAWKTYTLSLRLSKLNNAAVWHLFRLAGEHVYSKTKLG